MKTQNRKRNQQLELEANLRKLSGSGFFPPGHRKQHHHALVHKACHALSQACKPRLHLPYARSQQEHPDSSLSQPQCEQGRMLCGRQRNCSSRAFRPLLMILRNSVSSLLQHLACCAHFTIWCIEEENEAREEVEASHNPSIILIYAPKYFTPHLFQLCDLLRPLT